MRWLIRVTLFIVIVIAVALMAIDVTHAWLGKLVDLIVGR